MADRMGWGIAGMGTRSRQVMVPALMASPGSRIAGVVGRDQARTREQTKDWPDLKVFPSIDALLAEPDLDVLYICAPHHLHVPLAVQAIDAGKHVFMESPLALSVDGAHKLVEKAKNKGVRLGVAFQSRFHPAIAALHNIIAAGDLGEIELIEITIAQPVRLAETWWADSLRSGPAALFRLGVHALDLAVWLKGRTVSEVTAMGDEIDKGLNTIASALLKFSDGSFASATGTTRLPKTSHRIHVEGAQGSARIIGDLSGNGPAVLVQSGPGPEQEQLFEPAHPAQTMLTAFTESIESQTDFLPDGGDGQRLVEITCAVIESMKARRAVRVGEIARPA